VDTLVYLQLVGTKRGIELNKLRGL
jgi:hypothetical protein